MTLEDLVKQFDRNSAAYKEIGRPGEAQCWNTAARLLEEYMNQEPKTFQEQLDEYTRNLMKSLEERRL
jgi:hypothetical protein